MGSASEGVSLHGSDGVSLVVLLVGPSLVTPVHAQLTGGVDTSGLSVQQQTRTMGKGRMSSGVNNAATSKTQ